MSGLFEEGQGEMEKVAAAGLLGGRGYRGAQTAKVAEPLSYVERLYQRKVEMEAELAKLNEALEALQKNPEIEKVLHAITKVTGLY